MSKRLTLLLERGSYVTHKVGMGVAFVAFSAFFGPFLLRDPPLVGGYSRREWLSIAIGMVAWGLVLELLFGLPSAVFEWQSSIATP